MDTKLTLKLDDGVIKKAKKYAGSHHKSLSRMIESYLKSLTDKEEASVVNDIEISSYVKSMKSGVKIPADFDEKQAVADHLLEKYK